MSSEEASSLFPKYGTITKTLGLVGAGAAVLGLTYYQFFSKKKKQFASRPGEQSENPQSFNTNQ